MIKESKYCTDIMKKKLRKNLRQLKKMIKALKTLNFGFFIIFMLRVMLKLQIIAISLENTMALHREIAISMLN